MANRHRNIIKMTVAAVLLIVLILVSMMLGRYNLSFHDVMNYFFNRADSSTKLILKLRFTRIVAVILVGAGLSMAGATFQSVFNNGLASPNILGVATGASVGAAFAILNGLPIYLIELFAFVMGVLTMFLTLLINHFLHNNSGITLILAGIIMAGLMQSILGSIKYVADPEDQLQSIVYWELGSFMKVDLSSLMSVGPVLLVGILLLFFARWRLNVLSLDEATIKTIGINPNLNRNLMILVATLLTSAAVCLCGVIGWVGLVVPHISRSIVGGDNRNAMPMTGITGAILLLIADTLARSISVNDIPLSIVTGFIGVPIFVFILLRRKDTVV
ncbi:FecCD family ABC transporter permease [Companilactobacillus sp.]|uniref:FecCD family ABC transporter permease n=1 Tax=Companilactobacillus sp. TaxID=2767905 RepID=UPI0025B918AE|nr:iron ABC transporter permease [Companilactobacillus sp.]MCH4009243.1 iron ABC transporter permease [Companilactobacillus sp.]MCH4050578.1 iron ABC transporter permease [Companilactobacillus sp.]MCH4077185.1 iron ABC transporter permease [Companilactobacillus sp.]MCH4125761.1 iron ABC transporter permease [Companilactobacillus sp.]MCI1311470.1 iron ABC transporter permease [Companilactobacillus sp.]